MKHKVEYKKWSKTFIFASDEYIMKTYVCHVNQILITGRMFYLYNEICSLKYKKRALLEEQQGSSCFPWS